VGSVSRNHARLDIQLYLDIPNEVLDKFNKPGYKPNAITVLNMLLVGADGPHELVQAVEKYAYDVRTKVSGGNVQLARDKHLGVTP
jgi:cobalamin biosynthesis Co2+ chelatase CbiK